MSEATRIDAGAVIDALTREIGQLTQRAIIAELAADQLRRENAELAAAADPGPEA